MMGGMNTQTETKSAGAPPIPNLTLGWRLRMALEFGDGMTMEQIGNALGVTRTTASRWMHDETRPKRAFILQWALITGVDAGWLETGEWAPWDSNPQPTDWVPGVVLTGPWGGAA